MPLIEQFCIALDTLLALWILKRYFELPRLVLVNNLKASVTYLTLVFLRHRSWWPIFQQITSVRFVWILPSYVKVIEAKGAVQVMFLTLVTWNLGHSDPYLNQCGVLPTWKFREILSFLNKLEFKTQYKQTSPGDVFEVGDLINRSGWPIF